ncbi:MAG: hypothetical protein HKN80_00305 [Acidimicrobiia bacterium]|nr:hypothetical protein [Acidimicrobiia bacterium]
MFWFGRPSYWRWAAAAILVVGALVIEFWPTEQVPYPFAAAPIGPGEPFEVEWRQLPASAYDRPPLIGAVAAHALEEGEPITLSDVQRPVSVPAGWWALALEVPTRLAPGSPTQLVLAGGEGPAVPGIVVASEDPDRFGASGPTALIAVPAADASRVAVAAAARQITVLVAP